MKKIKVLVLYGGRSAEREISMITGKQVIAHLDRTKYQMASLKIPRRGNGWLVKLLAHKPDVVIPALHGPFGEDGTIQGLLEMLGLRYTFSGVLASALAMDKYRTVKFLRAQGIRTPRGILCAPDTPLQVIRRKIGFPCVVKPNRLGSSVGITVKVRNGQDLRRALKLAFSYDREVLAEEYVNGREITAGVLGNEKPRSLPLVEIIPKSGNFYDYKSKYAKGGSKHLIPASLSHSLTKNIQKIAKRVHQLLGACGVSRSDFILKGKTPYFIELNTIPGMTSTSLLPQAAQSAHISFSKLLDQLINYALRKH